MCIRFFFTIIKEGSFNASVSFAYHHSLSLGLFTYAIMLAPIYYYHLKIHITLLYRMLLYVILPTLIAFVFWYFYIYLSYSASHWMEDSIYKTIKYILIISYLQSLIILMTLVSVISDIMFNLIRVIIFLMKNIIIRDAGRL
ncbi:hypothetical protein AYY17_10350 [Morganella psychrotolerans]|uniref:Uncharacterized protein n=1 Tax=Morganella psychrotolerans TaxID=368603 RepID=A0A1B8H2T3_9GAMM|nr:hypothetical protein AYY17_10350 [Morganella psychrotolerans]